MKFPWKKVAAGAQRGLALAGLFDPHVAAVEALVESVEHIVGDGRGPDKKKMVEDVSDAVLESELLAMTDEQRAAIREARSSVIDCVVVFKDAEAAAEHAKDAAVRKQAA